MATTTIHMSSNDEAAGSSSPHSILRAKRARLRKKSKNVAPHPIGQVGIPTFTQEAPIAASGRKLGIDEQSIKFAATPMTIHGGKNKVSEHEHPGVERAATTSLMMKPKAVRSSGTGGRVVDINVSQTVKRIPMIPPKQADKLNEASRESYWTEYRANQILRYSKNFLAKESFHLEIGFEKKLEAIEDALTKMVKDRSTCDANLFDDVRQMIRIHKDRIASALGPTIPKIKSRPFRSESRRFVTDKKAAQFDENRLDRLRRPNYPPFSSHFGTGYHDFFQKFQQSDPLDPGGLVSAELRGYVGGLKPEADVSHEDANIRLAWLRGRRRRRIQEALRQFARGEEQGQANRATGFYTGPVWARYSSPHDLRLHLSLPHQKRTRPSGRFRLNISILENIASQDSRKSIVEQDNRVQYDGQPDAFVAAKACHSPLVILHKLDRVTLPITRLMFELSTGSKKDWSTRSSLLDGARTIKMRDAVPPLVAFLFDLLLDCRQWSHQVKGQFLSDQRIFVPHTPLHSGKRNLIPLTQRITQVESDALFALLNGKQSNFGDKGLHNLFLWLYQHVTWAICQNHALTNGSELRKQRRSGQVLMKKLAVETQSLSNTKPVHLPVWEELEDSLANIGPANHFGVANSSMDSAVKEHLTADVLPDDIYQHIWGPGDENTASRRKIWFSLDHVSGKRPPDEVQTSLGSRKRRKTHTELKSHLFGNVRPATKQVPQKSEPRTSRSDLSRHHPQIHKKTTPASLLVTKIHVRGIPPFSFGETPHQRALMGRAIERDLDGVYGSHADQPETDSSTKYTSQTSAAAKKSFDLPKVPDDLLDAVPALTYWGVFTLDGLHPALSEAD